MRISRCLSAAVAGALTVGGAFIAYPSADAATLESLHGTKSATMARANVTTIAEVQNTMDYPVSLYIGESNSWFGPIDAHSTQTTTIAVPWVGNQGEMSKSISVYKEGLACGPDQPCHPAKFFLYDIFQDYWEPSDQVKYGFYNSYDVPPPVPVPGDSTGGGNKRLVIAPDKPYMQALS